MSGKKMPAICDGNVTSSIQFTNNDSPNTPSDSIKNPPKSFGTDDGFKGPGAACGSSIVKVAQQMVSSRSLTGRGFKIANFDQGSSSSSTSDPDSSFQTKTVEDQQVQASKLIQPQSKLIDDDNFGEQQRSLLLNQQQQQQTNQDQQQITQSVSNRLMLRRGSKSLPSSPLSSPKSMRKYNPNPYFTNTSSLFSPSNIGSSEGRGWFLSSILGIQREATSTTSIHPHIEEESESDLLSPNKDSISNSNNNNNNINNSSKISEHQKILKAKPSELREMNFWSPTSM